MHQLHFWTMPPPCTRASLSALKLVSFTRLAPFDAGLGSASAALMPRALHRFERILHDLRALGLSIPHEIQFWVLYRNLSLEERGLLSYVSGVAERLGPPWDETPDACADWQEI